MKDNSVKYIYHIVPVYRYVIYCNSVLSKNYFRHCDLVKYLRKHIGESVIVDVFSYEGFLASYGFCSLSFSDIDSVPSVIRLPLVCKAWKEVNP